MNIQQINKYYFFIKNWRLNEAGSFVHTVIFTCLLNFVILNSVAAQENQIENLHLYIKPDGLYLDAKMQLELSQDAIDALDKGVALHFVAHVEVKRERWYWFDATDAQAQKVIKLSYQPLLRKYRVAIGGLGQTLNSLAEALNVVGSVSQWHILDEAALDSSAHKVLLFSFDLDRSQLPSPFQYGIRNNRSWDLHLHEQVDLQMKFSGGNNE